MKRFARILIPILIVSGVLFSGYYYHSKVEKSRIMYQDSITMYKDKVGHLYSALEIHQLAIKDLSDSLKKEAKNQDNPIYASRTRVNVRIDSVIVFKTDTIFMKNDSIHVIRSSYDDGYAKLNSTIVSKDSTSRMSLDSLSINADIYSNIILKEGKYYNVIRSNNPYLRIKNQEGAFIQDKVKKSSRWGLTLGVGYGVNYHGQCYPYLGIMFGYRIF